jgi:formamidopyrimidine-DNA glycosylase
MPELPDVETVVRMLRRTIVGRRIGRVRVLSPSTIRSPSPRRFTRLLRGRTIEQVTRRGKYLLIGLDRGLTLVAHLRMTGDFAVVPRAEPAHRHTRVVLALDGDEVRFVDQRRFGHMDLVPTREVDQVPGLRHLGSEPLGRAFTLGKFRALLQRRHGTLKGLLLRQDVIAGIGNIYADEILFQARLHPARGVDSLRPAELQRLHQAIRSVLQRATQGLSRYGRPVGVLLESRTKDARCPRCGRALATSRIAGRTTYYCRFCQRPGGR